MEQGECQVKAQLLLPERSERGCMLTSGPVRKEKSMVRKRGVSCSSYVLE